MKQRKYFKLNSVFNSKKISANHENTSYIDPVSKLIVSGEPDILWENIVFIEDIKKVWTHGNLYSGVINKNIEDVDFETDKFSDFVPTSYNTAYNLNNITYILSGSINTVDNKKVDKEDGKQLSSNDYTTNEKNKLTNLKGVDVVNSSSTTIGSDVKIWIDTSKNYGELDPNQIVQTRGQSTTNVMSQKAVTDAIENPIDLIGTDGYYSLYYLKYNGRTIPVQHFEKNAVAIHEYQQIGTKISKYSLYEANRLYNIDLNQDGFIHNGKLLVSDADGGGYFRIYNLSNGTLIGSMAIDKYSINKAHGNSVQKLAINEGSGQSVTTSFTLSTTIYDGTDGTQGKIMSGLRCCSAYIDFSDASDESYVILPNSTGGCGLGVYKSDCTASGSLSEFLGFLKNDLSVIGIATTSGNRWIAGGTKITIGQLRLLNSNANGLVFMCYTNSEPESYSIYKYVDTLYTYSNIYNSYSSETTAEGKRMGQLCVYQTNISGLTNTLMQLIRITFVTDSTKWVNHTDARPFGNFIVDSDHSYLYAYVMDTTNNQTKWYKFNLPAISAGTYSSTYQCNVVDLNWTDVLDTWTTSYMNFMQGCTHYNNLLWTTEGFNDDPINSTTIKVIDPNAHQQIAIFDLYNDGLTHESEWIDFYNGTLYFGMAPSLEKMILI